VVEVLAVEKEVKPPVSVEEKSRDPSTPARGVARSSAGGFRVYDRDFNVVGYVVKTLKAYFNKNASVCGVCMYPYELVQIRRRAGAFALARYAIIELKHSHSSDSTITRVVRKWVNDDEVERFKNLDFSELVKELEEE
jgi:hypothetical protein